LILVYANLVVLANPIGCFLMNLMLSVFHQNSFLLVGICTYYFSCRI